MSTKFFNNTTGNTLFDKLKGIAAGMINFDRFLAVVGFFRSSGYFKLRKELVNVKEIKILVGINIDDIFRKHNKGMMMLSDGTRAKEIYENGFKQDILDAKYSAEVEEGILQMCQDIIDDKLQIRIYDQKNLHAKFYLCLPNDYNDNTDGWVIMGSSNISEAGLGITKAPQYELNVALKDYDDVDYCHEEFKKLWERSIPLTPADIEKFKNETYLGYQPTPYELYIKVLINAFGDQVEDDFTIQLPDGVKSLKYQKDAVIQGYQMLMKHNGLFLADVVGLGKTMIATMIAKRFIEANGRNTNILVIYPPSLEENWKSTFKLFGIQKKAQFVTNGSLKKVLNGEDQYKDKEEFNLIIVDEAHGFRSDSSGKYDELQKICKSNCSSMGLLRCENKKVMLLSATPLNNSPEDLLSELLLFQNSQSCTIDGIPKLKEFFLPFISEYNRLMRNRDKDKNITEKVEKIYNEIREEVIDKVTVRRTRTNIMNDPDYRADIKAQGIVFPHIEKPEALSYKMAEDTSRRFYETLMALSDEKEIPHLYYARYRAVEFLVEEKRKKYKNAVHVGQTLALIYRIHMVKRLESSFYAFKESLATLLRITNDMLKMFNEDKVLIIPDMDVKNLRDRGMELDEIIKLALEKGKSESDIAYRAKDFDPKFLDMLNHDRQMLERLNEDWQQEEKDPKFDTFCKGMEEEFFNPQKNPTGKLVLFSESVDTLKYLQRRIANELNRKDILMVTAKNRKSLAQTIKENFDANSDIKKDKYNIIITSDVLAEGVNLHRSNVIVNYDSPWNATRLMQRIGRVNRIGSVADHIYNYMFYPSAEGDKIIRLYKNALIKLQGFHSAFGEDAQIYSHEEIVKQFELFDSKVKDSVDKKIKLLREVRELYNKDRKLYYKIKNLPMKSRVMRNTGKHSGYTVIFIQSTVKTEFFLAKGDTTPVPVDFLEAVTYLKAKPEEQAVAFKRASLHYEQVNRALQSYTAEYVKAADTYSINKKSVDKVSQEAGKFLRTVKQISEDAELKKLCDILTSYVKEGIYARLPRELRAISREYKNDRFRMKKDEYIIQKLISSLADEYRNTLTTEQKEAVINADPKIIITESFV